MNITKKIKSSQIKFFGMLLLLVGGLLIVNSVGLKGLYPDRLRQFILSFGGWAPLLFIALYTLRPVVLFPATILTLTGGLAFGPWYGTVYVLIGATLGSYLAFFIARILGRETLAKLSAGKLQTFDEKAEKHGFKTILIMRLIIVFPFDAVSYGAGLSRIKFRDYALATPIGILPATFIYNFLGSSLRNIFTKEFIAAIGLLLLVTIVPIVLKRTKKYKNKV